jgi:tetratricopeptide (TPR) repeat protein
VSFDHLISALSVAHLRIHWTVKKFFAPVFLLSLIFGLASCASEQASLSPVDPHETVESIKNKLYSDNDSKVTDPMILSGLEFIEKSEYENATEQFGAALKLDPRNAHAHFLNALSYHLLAEKGYKENLSLAETGYMISLNFDPSNYWASYLLGHIYFKWGKYRQAQDAFAFALLLESQNTQFMKGLLKSSYYAEDLDTALSTLQQIMKMGPLDSDTARTASLVYSAAADSTKAQEYFHQYAIMLCGEDNVCKRDNRNLIFISRRIEQWKNFFLQSKVIGSPDVKDSNLPDPPIKESAIRYPQKNVLAGYRVQLASLKSQSVAESERDRIKNKYKNQLNGMGLQIFPVELKSKGLFYRIQAGPIQTLDKAQLICQSLITMKQPCFVVHEKILKEKKGDHLVDRLLANPSLHQVGFGGDDSSADPFSTDDSSFGEDSSSDDDSSDSSTSFTSDGDDKAKKKKLEAPRMAHFDVAIIRTEEVYQASRGVNFLNGLKTTFDGVIGNWSQRGLGRENLDATTLGVTGQMTRGFSFSIPSSLSIIYSLNIANDNYDKNEIIARPTIIAVDGKTSDFFSGAVFHVELSASSGSLGTVTDVPVGVHLSVKPDFIDDQNMIVKVQAARHYIEGRDANAGFQNFTQTTKNDVTANVILGFDETLIIAGLSEKSKETINDEVPIVGDIPIIQYLFSNTKEVETTKSIIILITPRNPTHAHKDGTKKNQKQTKRNWPESDNLKELKGQKNWSKVTPNLQLVLKELSTWGPFREYRTGDMRLESWSRIENRSSFWNRFLKYLYF